ncbi:RNA polymerase beta subunit [Erwinia phage Ea35-70]|uniref:Putative DNA-directed RNA polymerase beta subunit n=1 Tax=Erwinia phage Ea35-70 TaxID=1429768 RepID=W6ARH8_9CAUD|nr:RNA polymerase beta subunit [Erwinia phage Ea35-70]AHI60373.1 putative DNA-directed RNA polymerase beta subunit [Erwinia phage Ea35-70]
MMHEMQAAQPALVQEGGLTAVVGNHDQHFFMLSRPPIIANDYDLSIEADRQALNNHLRVSYDTDMFSVKPKCQCGHTSGGDKVGKLCVKCGTKVTTVTEEEIESQLWLRKPEGVKGFINPQLWLLFFEPFNVKGFNPMEWFADRSYTPAKGGMDYKNKDVYKVCADMGIERGINSLYDNFDAIVTNLLNSPVVRDQVTSQEVLRQRSDLFIKYRDRFFCEHLPMPSKLMFVVESNATGRYAAPEMKLALDAALTVCSAKRQLHTVRDVRFNESIAIKVVRQISKFYATHDSDNFAGKLGLLRKNIAGAKHPWTGRCVITSHTGDHDMDEVILPRCLAIPMLKYHIINKLRRRNYTPTQCLKLIQAGIKQTIPVIDEVLDELLAESPTASIRVYVQRNPTLRWLSNRRFHCRTINRDPNDISIRISTLSIKSSNADFDGDELNVMLQLDNVSANYAEAFGSHNCALDMNTPLKISGDVGLPGTLISTMNRWMYSND